MSERWTEAVAAVAARWEDPEHPPRAEAAAQTLAAENTFTEEGVAFVVNHAMHGLAEPALRMWIGDAAFSGTAAVLSLGRSPLEGLHDALAAVLLGGRARVSVVPASPALLPAFFAGVQEAVGEKRVAFAPQPAAFDGADVALGTGTQDEHAAWSRLADRHGIPEDRRLFRPVRFGVAVMDGKEDRAALSGLAEDVLLHDGAAPRSARLLWAPADLSPDPLLDALAAAREMLPAHPATDGRLAMPAAFLKAAKQSHAVGPGFLVSRGDPAVQDGAHLRWAEYDALSEVAGWLAEHEAEVGFVTTRPALAEALRAARLPAGIPVIEPGDAHRPSLEEAASGAVPFLSAG